MFIHTTSGVEIVVNPLGTPVFAIVFSGIRITESLVLCGMFYQPLIVFLSVSVWTLHSLSLDLWFLITPWYPQIVPQLDVSHQGDTRIGNTKLPCHSCSDPYTTLNTKTVRSLRQYHKDVINDIT